MKFQFESEVTHHIDRWRNRLAHSADNREVLSSSLSLSTIKGQILPGNGRGTESFLMSRKLVK